MLVNGVTPRRLAWLGLIVSAPMFVLEAHADPAAIVVAQNAGHDRPVVAFFERLFGNDAFTLTMPIAGATLTSGFGMRRNPILGTWTLHAGVDWSAPRGTPIYAAGDGIVISAGWENGYGYTTRILHDDGVETIYAHQSRITAGVVEGAVVSQGQMIGEVGSTGNATGPHLHYEVRLDGEPVDPFGAALRQAGLVVAN